MHLQFLIAVQEAIEFSLMAFGGFTLIVLAGFGLVKFWLYCLRLDSDQPSAISSQPDGESSGQEPSAKSHSPFPFFSGQWVRATRDIEWLGLFVAKGQIIQIELAHRTKTDSEPDALRYSGTCYPDAELILLQDGFRFESGTLWKNFFVFPIPPEAIEALPGVPADGSHANGICQDERTGSGQAASG